jgi:hypothetical protein
MSGSATSASMSVTQSIADDAGLVDVLGEKPSSEAVGGKSFRLGNDLRIAAGMLSNLAPRLRCIVFVG